MLLVSTIQPLAQLASEEFTKKLDLPGVRFNFRKLQAADVAARARAFGSLAQGYVAAGVESQDIDIPRLEKLAGLDE